METAGLLLNASGGLALGIDCEGKILHASEASAELLAYPREHLLRASLADIVCPGHLDVLNGMLRNAASGATEEQACLRFIGGLPESRWLEVTVKPAQVYSDYPYFALFGYDVTKWVHAENALKEKYLLDPLTGLGNRVLMRKTISENILAAIRSNTQFAVALLDLDGFKKINDTSGHDVGDALLKEVAARLKSSVRAEDTVARMGGDEFVLLLPRITHQSQAVAMAERVIRAFLQPFRIGGQQLRVTTSLGLAFFDSQSLTESALLKRADLAMYQAKDAGKNQLCVYTAAIESRIQAQFDTEQSMFTGVQNGEFCMHYQPIFEPQTKAVVSVEALMRWNRPGGAVPPGDFIPVAEQNGMIHLLGQWALRSACAQLVQWDQEGLVLKTLSVNVSPVQLKHPEFVDSVKAAINDSGIDANRLVLEITEGALMADPEHTEEVLKELCHFGVMFAVDDFGTGYSSLAYLRRFPLKALKIDRSFIADMLVDRPGKAIVFAVLSLARELGLKVVAEGVETEEQRIILAEQGCSYAQGWLVAPALSPEEFKEEVKARSFTLLV
ncbi:bifunctional diguanylate cyclase/phosphodiesterase [Nostoc sp. CHAB 5834]|nr:bifunctional diguanylate cyclase/phosphodiesterase [Nostoc sp. CHAB 5834]